VMLAGMGGVADRLVGDVSEAGGFGCLGASVMSTDEMVEQMRPVRRATDKLFGVDLLPLEDGVRSWPPDGRGPA